MEQIQDKELAYPLDFAEFNMKICNRVSPFTLTSAERINALVEAVKYIVINGIEGALVECGVWKGGSIMAIALTLKAFGDTTRDLYLYDTFSGMSVPTEVDISIYGEKAQTRFSQLRNPDDSSSWCECSLEEVKENVFSIGYPKEKIHFVKGKVEDTIPQTLPNKIALLRLDTDWYESTKHELTHLFPLVTLNGILIIDDYGHWEGSRKATDDYIEENSICILLNRIDYTGRIAVKTQRTS